MEHDTEPTETELTEASETETGQDDSESESGPDVAPVAAGDDRAAPAPQATGDARVDAAIAHLVELGELPVSAHPPIFERIHGQLVEVLGDLHTGASLAEPAEPGEQPAR